MKSTLIALASLGLAIASPAQDKPLTVKPNLQKTLNNLDTDGDHLSITNIKDDLKFYADLFDSVFLDTIKKTKPEYEKISALKILSISGLDQATTLGRSSKWVNDHYHNRVFLETGGSNFGLMSLFDNKPKTWQSAAFAPADADLLLETSINLSQVPEIINQVAKLMPAEDTPQLTEFLDEPIPGSPMKVRELLQDFNARLSIVLRLDDSKMWSPEKGINLPAFQVCARIDGISKKVWPLIKDQLAQQLPYTTEGNVHTILYPEAMPTPWGDIQPILIVNLDTDQIWIADTQAFLKSSQSADKKLLANPAYIAANQGLPTEGFAHTFISKKALKTLQSSLSAVVEQASAEEDAIDPKAIEKEIQDFLKSKSGYALAAKHDNNGLLIVANSPMADKGNSLATQYYTTVPFLAAMSYGPFMRQVKASKSVEAMNKMKNLYAACFSYAVDNEGLFPPNLQALEDAGEVDNLPLFTTIDWPLKGDQITYIPGLNTTSNPNFIVMHSKTNEDDEIIVARLNGAVQKISVLEFEEQIKKQQNK